MLCFADASSFTRAFRREFGMSPKEVRAASPGGLSPRCQWPRARRTFGTSRLPAFVLIGFEGSS
ncbi:MAG: helix-turn-helix transcriptional regulator [Rhodospirillales bacterium]|nr:helix-turn-helix transcriptional regulator [Rhodospirillales bacterium]